MKNIGTTVAAGLILSFLAGLSAPSIASAGSKNTEVAQVTSTALRLHVLTKCVNGAAVFSVKNEGASLPKLATFTLYRVNQNKVVYKRRMRLKAGQTATFKLKNAHQISDQIGLFVDPEWYPRERQPDAKISCS